MAAMAAVANFATMQTGATAAGLAYEAHTAAGKAMAAYTHAKAASEAAAAAEDVTAAVEARIMAEDASANAVMYAMTAAEKAGEAETAAMAELMIVGTVKTVGGTDLDAEAGSSEVITDGNTVRTGLMAKGYQPMHTAADTVGVTGVAAEPDADVKYVAPVAVATGGAFPIGKLVDSADDTARLMIVTQYGGSKTVNVYNEGSLATPVGTKAGYLSIDDTGTTDVNEATANANNVALKSEGTYYPNGTGGNLAQTDAVAFKAMGEEVFSYVNPNDDMKHYVVLFTETKAGTTTTYRYNDADIHVPLDVDGDGTNEDVKVTAKIPEATDYNHIHYGVWAAPGDPAKDGTQELSDLGIGFVQNFSGEGLTSIGGTSDDMPNGGDATYNGNWVAAVQAADDDGNGAIALLNNAATLTADFGKATISADLTGLATLTGAIAGNTFSGTKAKLAATPMGGLTAADFTGSFSGGFYGAKAVEAGGIFDFTSEGAEDGAFRGAFGGKK